MRISQMGFLIETTCSQCGGKGSLRMVCVEAGRGVYMYISLGFAHLTLFFFFFLVCGVQQDCRSCGGDGQVLVDKEVDVKVPAGTSPLSD